MSTHSSYEQIGRELEREAAALDFKSAADAIGGSYLISAGEEAIALKMINAVYELRKEGLFLNDAYCDDLWARIIIYDYARRQGRYPLTGQLLALDQFPHAPSHTRTFQGAAQKKITARFEKDLDGLIQRSEALGGGKAENKVNADYAARFELLPLVPLYLSFWRADEEFPAECKLLFDSSARDNLDINYLSYLLERFAEELVSGTTGNL